jgi:hypothetical protein
MALLRMLVLVTGFVIGVAALSGCENEGPLERAGENVDDAVDDAGDAVEDAGEEIEDAVDD